MVVPLSAFHTAHSNVKTFIFSIVYFEPHTHFSASNTQTHTHTHLTVCAQQWRSSQEVTEWHNLHKSGFVHFSIHHLSFCKRKRESRIAFSIFYLYAMFCAACPLLCCHLKEKQSAISLNVYVHHSHIICLFIIWWVGACVCERKCILWRIMFMDMLICSWYGSTLELYISCCCLRCMYEWVSVVHCTSVKLCSSISLVIPNNLQRFSIFIAITFVHGNRKQKHNAYCHLDFWRSNE